jgi:hypothetical protein
MYAYLGKYAYIWKSTNIYEYICIWTCIWIYIYIQIHLRCVLANYQLLFLLPKHEGAGLEVQLPRPNCPLLLQTQAHSVPSIISVMEYNLPVDTSPTTPPHNASLARTCSHNPSGAVPQNFYAPTSPHFICFQSTWNQNWMYTPIFLGYKIHTYLCTYTCI